MDCYYIIGIQTTDENAMYQLEVKSIDAWKTYANLLRIGDNKMIRMEPR